MRWVFVGLMGVHGLIHGTGVAKVFGWAELEALQGAISRPMGVLWGVASLLVLATAALVALRVPGWWWVGGVAAVASQAVGSTTCGWPGRAGSGGSRETPG